MHRANGRITDPRRPGVARIVIGTGLVLAAVAVAWCSRAAPEAPQAWVAQQEVPQHGQADAAAFTLAPVSVPRQEVLWSTDVVPTGRAARTIRVGEPLLSGDLAAESQHPLVTLPVDPQNLPPGLQPGDTVDVWTAGQSAALVPGAVVQSVSPPDIGPGRVEVAVPGAQVTSAVRAAATDRLVLVRLP